MAQGTNLLSILLQKFVKSSEATYACCVAAVQCLTFIAKGLAIKVDASKPLKICASYNASEVMPKKSCDAKSLSSLGSPPQSPLARDEFSSSKLTIELNGVTIEFGESEASDSPICSTKSDHSFPFERKPKCQSDIASEVGRYFYIHTNVFEILFKISLNFVTLYRYI